MGRVVILAVDDSDHSERAYTFYESSVRMPDDHLVLVHCAEASLRSVNRSVMQGAPPGGAYGRDTLHEIVSSSEQDAKSVEGKFQKLMKPKEIDYRMETRYGKPGEQIVGLAEEEKATLLIMGTRGMNKLRRTVLGSVSSYVVNHAHCPVLVVRD